MERSSAGKLYAGQRGAQNGGVASFPNPSRLARFELSVLRDF